MNDRFRFRAWNKEEKKMYYDAQDTYDYMTGKPIIFAESFGCLLINDEEWKVEQCTGLKDKNGKLIYEGDIVLFYDDDECPWQIKWDKIFLRWVLYSKLTSNEDGIEELTDTDAEYLEIIGNIHEQAEQKEQELDKGE